MRWLLIVLAVSVCALLAASVGLGMHIWRQRRTAGASAESAAHRESDAESEEAQ